MVSVTDPYGRIIEFIDRSLDRSTLYFLSVPSVPGQVETTSIRTVCDLGDVVICSKTQRYDKTFEEVSCRM
jgi:hypothetical protein